ncbi:hypothetical protein CAPTEDRAFT_160730 [Capitella teleta]|uniref:BTB domain-containing protein n=1 Tax=Capitella teleta TaxID=283909 RepID=R7U828_CAPTE|nr:hypothetical protein CAPTEDRAFT_160730 [Capitella teleta]|eukprot:ELT99275.1 hypothetical protein CAPTEDRAFT_160730 [Capitella teleta]
MTDVTLILPDQSTINCHKLVLASASPFFEAMFQSGFKESTQKEVYLDFTDSEMIRSFVDYFYSGEIDINSDNIGDIVTGSEFLCLDDLKTHCGAFMTSQVDSSNCIAFYRCARQYSLGELASHCFEHMLSHFEYDFCSSESFVDLSKEELIEVLSDDRLIVENEDIVLHSVVRWVEADLEERKTAFVRIAPFIRFPFCTSELLGYKAKTQTLLKMYGNSFHYTDELNGEHTEWKGFHNNFSIKLNNVLAPNGLNWIYAKKHHIYDIDTKSEVQFGAQWMTPQRSDFSLTFIQNKLFAFGGKLNEQISSKVDSFDQQSRKWKQQPKEMPHAVSKSYVVPFETKIYVLGGIATYGPTTVNQEFDPIWDKWQLKQSMPGVCESGAAVSLNTSIFVVGGAERACFRYTPTTDTWIVLSHPTHVHTLSTAITAWEGNILLCGGDHGEEYNPDTDDWSPCDTLVPDKHPSHSYKCILQI